MAAPHTSVDTVVPQVPSAADLAQLSTPVALLLLATIIVSIVMVYLGPALRSRLTRTRTTPEPTTPAPAPATPPQPAVDRAADVTQQYIDHLLHQLSRSAEREADLERQLDQVRQDNTRLQGLLWQWQQRGMSG